VKIALLSPFFQPVVEPFVGGTEAFVAHFAMALKQQGIDVVCYACEGSAIPGVEIRTLGVPQAALAYPRAPHELSCFKRMPMLSIMDQFLSPQCCEA